MTMTLKKESIVIAYGSNASNVSLSLGAECGYINRIDVISGADTSCGVKITDASGLVVRELLSGDYTTKLEQPLPHVFVTSPLTLVTTGLASSYLAVDVWVEV
jgi:hypothetical protein